MMTKSEIGIIGLQDKPRNAKDCQKLGDAWHRSPSEMGGNQPFQHLDLGLLVFRTDRE